MYTNNYSNSDLRKLTKEDLVGNWGTAILLLILVGVISGLLSQLFSLFNLGGTSTAVVPPMTNNPDVLVPYIVETMEANVKTSSIASLITSVLIAIFNLGIDFGFLDTVDGNSLELEHLIAGFNGNIGKNILVIVITQLIISLGMIFIIPGIIFSYILLPVPYLLKDESDLGVMDMLKKSKDLMKGHKFNFFKTALPFYLIPIAIFATSTILLAILFTQENFALAILLFVIGILAGIVASFWADVKVRVLKAGYYRRILNPTNEDDDFFTDYEDADNSETYNEDTAYDDLNKDTYEENNHVFSNSSNNSYNENIESIIMAEDNDDSDTDENYYTTSEKDFGEDLDEESNAEYTDTEFMEDMILLGEEDLLFGDSGENEEDL